jgi:taurine dioxygenase/sulfonate dioxygenase
MAPSIAEIPEKTETTPITLPVKAIPGTKAKETKPKVRRVIDEEGGKTTASVGITCRSMET